MRVDIQKSGGGEGKPGGELAVTRSNILTLESIPNGERIKQALDRGSIDIGEFLALPQVIELLGDNQGQLKIQNGLKKLREDMESKNSSWYRNYSDFMISANEVLEKLISSETGPITTRSFCNFSFQSVDGKLVFPNFGTLLTALSRFAILDNEYQNEFSESFYPELPSRDIESELPTPIGVLAQALQHANEGSQASYLTLSKQIECDYHIEQNRRPLPDRVDRANHYRDNIIDACSQIWGRLFETEEELSHFKNLEFCSADGFRQGSGIGLLQSFHELIDSDHPFLLSENLRLLRSPRPGSVALDLTSAVLTAHEPNSAAPLRSIKRPGSKIFCIEHLKDYQPISNRELNKGIDIDDFFRLPEVRKITGGAKLRTLDPVLIQQLDNLFGEWVYKRCPLSLAIHQFFSKHGADLDGPLTTASFPEFAFYGSTGNILFPSFGAFLTEKVTETPLELNARSDFSFSCGKRPSYWDPSRKITPIGALYLSRSSISMSAEDELRLSQQMDYDFHLKALTEWIGTSYEDLGEDKCALTVIEMCYQVFGEIPTLSKLIKGVGDRLFISPGGRLKVYGGELIRNMQKILDNKSELAGKQKRHLTDDLIKYLREKIMRSFSP